MTIGYSFTKMIKKNIDINKNEITFIGDSNVRFFLLNEYFAKINEGKTVLAFNKNIFNNTINLISISGKTAYSMTTDYLLKEINNIIPLLKKSKAIVFVFGTNDINKHIAKHKNHAEVIKKYLEECIKISKKNNSSIFIISPIIKDFQNIDFLIWNKIMKEECLKKNITFIDISLILEINRIEQDTYSWDIYDHFGYYGNKTIVEKTLNEISLI